MDKNNDVLNSMESRTYQARGDEVNVEYGLPLPEKAEEIQTKISHEISRLTGLHVSTIHVVFKNLIIPGPEVEQVEEPSLIEVKEVTEAIDAGEVIS